MDASQRRMMAFMLPVVMGFTLSNFAAGLSVYWATGNVINLLIQLGLSKTKEGQELRERAKKQAAKRGVGGAKTIPGKR
jgi:YidC/Oxa1 family membrane protein insertase